MNIVQCTQGSGEWLQARTGRITASEIADATRTLKVKRGSKEVGASSDTRDKYILALAGEILTGKSAENFVSKWMQRGTEMEPLSREEYSIREGVTVRQVGFVIHPTIPRSGASPDGIVPGVRGLELKNPKIETHLGWMMAGVLPPEYEPQVMWGMACTELPEWDFVSYCDDIRDEAMQMFRVRVPRNPERIAELEDRVRSTLADVDAVLAKLRAMARPVEYLRETLREAVEETPLVLTGNHDEDWRTVADSLSGFATP